MHPEWRSAEDERLPFPLPRPVCLALFCDHPGSESHSQVPSNYRWRDEVNGSLPAGLTQQQVRNVFWPLQVLAQVRTGHLRQLLICSSPVKPDRRGPGGTPCAWAFCGDNSFDGASSLAVPLRTLGQHEGIFMQTINPGLERANLSPNHSSCIPFSLPFFNLKDTAES